MFAHTKFIALLLSALAKPPAVTNGVGMVLCILQVSSLPLSLLALEKIYQFQH